MDAIADQAFKTEAGNKHTSTDSPSLLTVIIDSNPVIWDKLKDKLTFKSMLQTLTISINAHLALNNSNEIAVIANHYSGAKFLYPGLNESTVNVEAETKFVQKEMYRQFRLIDEKFLENSFNLFAGDVPNRPPKNALSASLTLALSYINKKQLSSESNLKARVLVVNVSQDEHLKYIPVMNSIFAAQKMKIPIDVCQLHNDSTFLQQASDATNGVYMRGRNPDGLIQYFTSILFIDPSLRNILITPTSGEIDFRASCFLTGKVVDIGYVCSVCLCILSYIPNDQKCPACESEFDNNVIMKLKKKPVVVRNGGKKIKKRKLENGAPAASSPANGTPLPS